MMNLELRRQVWEALGAKVEERDGLWICVNHNGNPLSPNQWVLPEQAWPHIELNNGIALDALVKFCRERKYWWNIGTGYVEDGRKYFYCNIGHMPNGNAYTLSNEQGNAPAEAICRALIKATENSK